MSLFRKIFGKKTDDPNQKIDDDGRSKYMPDIELPIDERFTIQFKIGMDGFKIIVHVN